jgi:hypothetical protein
MGERHVFTALDREIDIPVIRNVSNELILLKRVFDLDGFDLRAFALREDLDGLILIDLTVEKLGDIFLVRLHHRGNNGEINDQTDDRKYRENDRDSCGLLERRFFNVALCEKIFDFLEKISHEWRLLT